MRIFQPTENVYAFYDGRPEDDAQTDGGGWLEGTLSCGIASYAVRNGAEALVYDTHLSVDRAEFVRRSLEADGVESFTVLLSHWHLDHIAGNTTFADCELIASRRTHELLTQQRNAIESGSSPEGPPAIQPLVMPNRVIEGNADLILGSLTVELIPVDVHSQDSVVVWIPEQRILLAADTVEDPVTYVMEPGRLEVHLAGLDRLADLAPDRVFPSHGHPATIATGGYSDGLIRATREYVRALLTIAADPSLADTSLADLIDPSLEAGWITYFERYENVHRENVESVTRR